MALLSLVLCLAGEAHAGVTMWGVGPTVSTVLYPIRYPKAFPKAADDLGWSYDGSRGDFSLGAHGIFYVDMDSRLGARAGVGWGAGWSHRWIDVEYERIFTSDSGFHLLGGVGLGLGQDGFTDTVDNQLDASFFMGRADFGGIYRDKVRAYELDLYAQYSVVAEHRFTPAGSEESEVIKGAGSRYPAIGVEATVYFGDFTPPKSGKPKGGKGGVGKPK